MSSLLTSRPLISFGVLALAVVIAIVLVASKADVPTRPPQERVWSISAHTVALEDIRPVLNLYGEINAGRQADLRSLVPGEIATVHVAEGARVRKGTALVSLDPFDANAALREATASLEEAKAQLTLRQVAYEEQKNTLALAQEQEVIAARDLARSQKLVEQGIASSKNYDDKNMAHAQHRRAVSAGESGVAGEEARLRQQQATVTRLSVLVSRRQRDVENTVLYAPFDGFVHTLKAAQGVRVNTNEKLLTLVDAQALEVRFSLSDRQFARLSEYEALVGGEVSVMWHSYEIQGTVERTGASANAQTGTVDVYARLAGQSLDTPLRPKMFVQITMHDRPYRNVIHLPETALDTNNRVYVVNADNRLEARRVSVVGTDRRSLLVRGDLSDGETVATTLFPEAGAGARVQIRKESHRQAEVKPS